MKNTFKILILLCCILLLFCACTKKKAENSAEQLLSEEDIATEYDEENSVIIKLDGNKITASSNSVKISGTSATITEEATYIISGTLDDGMIIVDAGEKDKPRLVLKNADITSQSSAALYILEADKVIVTLDEGSENTLANGGSFEAIDDNNIDGAVFSKKDLTFNGNGALTVASPAGHGICAKDEFVAAGGSYTITAASHALDVNDSVVVRDVNFSFSSGKDGIHCENTEDTSFGFVCIESGSFDISAEGDGISASSYLKIDDGSFNIVTGGGSENAEQRSSQDWGFYPGSNYRQAALNTDSSESIKGMKSGTQLTVSKGDFTLNCADDGFHSGAEMTINGGDFLIASGDDAFHSDSNLNVSGGTINVTESYEGIEALDIEISGGEVTLVATDDGLNAAGGNDSSGYGGPRGDMFGGAGGSVVISGGTLIMSAEGDGIDSNGTLEVTGGVIQIDGPTVGDTSTLDYETSGTISGGSFIGTGGTGMNMCFDSSSAQGVIMVNAAGADGTEIKLVDSTENAIMTHTAKRGFDCVILSCDKIVAGGSYTLYIGSEAVEITMTSTVYNASGSMGNMPGGGGAMPGNMPGNMPDGGRRPGGEMRY